MLFKFSPLSGDEIIKLIGARPAFELPHFNLLFCHLHRSKPKGVRGAWRELSRDIFVLTRHNSKMLGGLNSSASLDQLGFTPNKDGMFGALEKSTDNFFCGIGRMRLNEDA